MLFPHLQWPYSPLKQDSTRYVEEAKAAIAAKEDTYKCPGRALTVEELKDLIEMTFDLGRYAVRPYTGKDEHHEEVWGSPMEID